MAPRDHDLHDLLEHRRHRRHRLDRRRRRRRAGSLFAGAVLAVTAVALLAGFGAGPARPASCDLRPPPPPPIAQNSFLHAAGATLLGSTPAERNRAPARLRRMAP